MITTLVTTAAPLIPINAVKIVTTPIQQFPVTPTMRPVPPLLATTPTGQRTILTDQSGKTIGQVGNLIAPRAQPTQTVTQIRIQPQATSNALQRRGLALTVIN